MKLKRLIALGAALILTATTFPSCGAPKETTKITNVFKESDLKLPEQYSGDNFNINQTFAAGDLIYAQCYLYDEKTYQSREFLLPINLDGTVGELRAAGVRFRGDVIEGVMLNTERCIRHAVAQGVPIIVAFTKMDRLITELKIPPQDAYYKFVAMLEEVCV